jgi:hypothetical protein
MLKKAFWLFQDYHAMNEANFCYLSFVATYRSHLQCFKQIYILFTPTNFVEQIAIQIQRPIHVIPRLETFVQGWIPLATAWPYWEIPSQLSLHCESRWHTNGSTECHSPYNQWFLQVMFPFACSFIVLVFTVLHYMSRPTWPCSDDLKKHVVKDSENQHNKAARKRKHNLQKPLNNTVQQDAKI